MTIKQEYAKELKNLKARIKRLEKKGIDTSSYSIPKQPKNITRKSVERLTKLRGKELQKQVEKATRKKAQEYIPDITIIGRVIEEISTLPDFRIFYRKGKEIFIDVSPTKQTALSLIDDRRGIEGDVNLANDLLRNETRIFQDTFIITYDSSESNVRSSIVSLLVTLKGTALTFEEATQADDWASMMSGLDEI